MNTITTDNRRDVRVRLHEVKIYPSQYQPILDGDKFFDVREDDRGYQRGDTIHYREWDPTSKQYTGRESRMEITHVQTWGGLSGGHVALGVRSDVLTVRDARSDLIVLRDEGGKLVLLINPDGQITFGDGVPMDEAARQFWGAVKAAVPEAFVRREG